MDINKEGLAISNIQAAEKVLKGDNVTIHVDSTSRDHKKTVSLQLTLDDGTTLFLGLKPVAVEESSTILDVTISLLKRLTKCYTDYFNEDFDEVFRTFLSKITSAMTDRAATMKCFDRKRNF